MMKRKKSPLLPRKSGTGDGSSTPKQSTPPTSSSSLAPSSAVSVTFNTPTLTGGPIFSGSSASRTVPQSSNSSTDEQFGINDWEESEILGLGCSTLSNGSTEGLALSGDEVDVSSLHPPEIPRTRAAIEHIQQKVNRAKDLIKAEQTARDDNVNEYLKLAANADKQQLQRIKNVFEKKNQKSAQTIAQLQKKLENYNKRIRDLETHGVSGSHRQPREVLRDVGQGLKDVGANIKEGITGLSGGVVGNIKGGLSGLSAVTHTAAETVMSKPREFAHLIKNRFGSADNISTLGKLPEENNTEDIERNLHGSATFTHSTKYTSDDESSSITSGSGQLATAGTSVSPHHHPPFQALVSTVQHTGSPTIGPSLVDLDPILKEMRDRREECQHLVEESDALKNQLQQECAFFNQALQEERYRYERLEEQMNDLIELHQNEIENLKQGIADMEEKVQYQSEERLRDVHEVLENCQTRISRMEHQQHQHLQQLVTLDSLENSHARALVLKLINVLLTVLQVVLLVVATISSVIMPFLKTRIRVLTTLFSIVVIVLLCRQWSDLTTNPRKALARMMDSLNS